MVGLEGFEQREGYARFQPAGPTSVPALLELLRKVRKACQELGVTRLLVDLTLLSHKPITTTDRFNFASGLASFWDRQIRVAVIGRTDQIEPERFGALVAQNRGLYLGGYTSEKEALEWLLETRQG